MDRTVDPMLDSIFNRLKTKLTNVQIHQPSTSSHLNPQFVNMNHSNFQPQQNVSNHFNSNSNQQLSSQSQPMTIKEDIEPMPTHQVQSSSYAPVSNEQSNPNLTDQPLNNDADENSQINLLDPEMQPQPLRFTSHIKQRQFDEEVCDCDECDDGGIEVKEEEEYDQVDEESSQPVKRPRMDTTQPNNEIHARNGHQQIFDLSHDSLLTRNVTPQQTHSTTFHSEIDNEEENVDYNKVEDCDGNELVNGLFDEEGRLESDAIDTQTTFGEHFSDESMVIQQEERDSTNAIKGASATECTTNLIQPNLVQTNRHLQCSNCHKSFDHLSKLQRHVRVHTGERPFQCDQCDKQFTQKPSFDFHLLIHSGERPFECRHCDKSFSQWNIRNSHEQAIHLHVKPYRCKQCGHTANEQSNVIKHIRIIHFGLPTTMKEQRELNIIDHRDPKE